MKTLHPQLLKQIPVKPACGRILIDIYFGWYSASLRLYRQEFFAKGAHFNGTLTKLRKYTSATKFRHHSRRAIKSQLLIRGRRNLPEVLKEAFLPTV